MSTALLLRDARLVGRDGTPTDLLIEDGVVSAIVAGVAPGRAEVVDLDGRWVAPGLWDNHVHMEQWALVRQRLDVSQASSAASAVELVRRRIAEGRPADRDLLVGYGFRDALWPDEPSAILLDSAGDIPVALVSGDLHAVWLNSSGLALVNQQDHPTGLLREQAAFDANGIITAIDSSRIDEWVVDATRAAAQRGVVGVVDLEMSLSLDAWVARVEQGADSLRVRCGVYPRDLDSVVERGLETGQPIPGGAGLVTMGPAKVITDGSLNTRTAYCHDPYPGHGGVGVASFTPEELVGLLRKASAAGLVPAVHAIGDHANSLALDAFEAVGCGGSIEHAQLVRFADIARFARLGLIASVQPEHAMDDRDIAEVYWEGRTDRAFPLETLSAAGVQLRLGSDAPVAPLDPWIAMAAAVTRSRDGREPWHPEQRLPAAVALEASADGRASVVADSVADLVVLDADPLAPGVDLRAMPVAATLLAGRFTHRGF
ncbi:amidohydrolase [Frondihabitans sucicola]|uniref:Amidohydrolase n=1 Tax=Frondihabitans sucicola TaxID=1268041 RepID=A0ABN6Y279_9MICO|nr:amidohydrolase family protein [Frondihabitans sucicola]BDZ49980.1 amidohydrolase [Frondihabitans sucicola]